MTCNDHAKNNCFQGYILRNGQGLLENAKIDQANVDNSIDNLVLQLVEGGVCEISAEYYRLIYR